MGIDNQQMLFWCFVYYGISILVQDYSYNISYESSKTYTGTAKRLY